MVVEVISPSERKARRFQKVGLYLDMGVPHVVEVDYTRRVVRIYTPDGDAAAVYRAGDQLQAPFRATVEQVFSVLD
jgi:Uma2 family endonuclease